MALVRAQRAHGERDDVHGAPAHRASEEALRERFPHSAGSRQLFVEPASCSSREQMKVRSSTRATSPGSDQARYELTLGVRGRSKVPESTRSWQSRSYSSAEPSRERRRRAGSGRRPAPPSSPVSRSSSARSWNSRGVTLLQVGCGTGISCPAQGLQALPERVGWPCERPAPAVRWIWSALIELDPTLGGCWFQPGALLDVGLDGRADPPHRARGA